MSPVNVFSASDLGLSVGVADAAHLVTVGVEDAQAGQSGDVDPRCRTHARQPSALTETDSERAPGTMLAVSESLAVPPPRESALLLVAVLGISASGPLTVQLLP